MATCAAAVQERASYEVIGDWLHQNLHGQRAEEAANIVRQHKAVVLRWHLLTLLGPDGRGPGPWANGRDFLLSHPDVLATFLCSGDLDGPRWKEAVALFGNIVAEDPSASTGLCMRLAVAIALVFAGTPEQGPLQIALPRYRAFRDWAASGQLFSSFQDLSAWHMRYVVCSRAMDDELIWAREKVPADTPQERLGKVAAKMVKYRKTNAEGVSINNGKEFYGGRKQTLQVVHEMGGVCGAVSKFAAGVCQAFGVPAMPVAQPGHCAFLWQNKPGSWGIGNDIKHLARTKCHKGWHMTWRKQAWAVILMEDAQANFEKFVESQCRLAVAHFVGGSSALRFIASTLEAFPENVAAWDLINLQLQCGATTLGGMVPLFQRLAAERLQKRHPLAAEHLSTSLQALSSDGAESDHDDYEDADPSDAKASVPARADSSSDEAATPLRCEGCSFAVTGVTPTHCCHACKAKPGQHGPKCLKQLATPGAKTAAQRGGTVAAIACASAGCSFAITGVTPAHCCNACKEKPGNHGPKCRKLPFEASQPQRTESSFKPPPRNGKPVEEQLTAAVISEAEAMVLNSLEETRSYSSVAGNDPPGHGAARSMLDSEQAWSAANARAGEWMQIDLGTAMTITGAVAQGRPDKKGKERVLTYRVEGSQDARTWQAVPGEFHCGVASQKVVSHFPSPLTARFVRFHALTWSRKPAMRAGVLVQ
mmetsp:Transcript_28820/g.67086  ORF Transcript_28820/g.67086 Transcript_28820/m.67086 type:complete len:706 (+) Transcript_28820:99-2216(+)